MMATTIGQPTQFCSNCGIGPFFFVQARRYPTLCLDCSDDVSRATGGPHVDGGVLYLTGSTNDAIEPVLVAAGWGLMLQPATYGAERGRRYPWTGLDNGCFWPKTFVGEDKWLDWLDRQERDRCLFAVVPDVARRPDGTLGGDPVATWERFRRLAPLVREMGYPVALAAQDRCERLPDFDTQLDACDCLFIAGSTRWKLSAAAFAAAGEARRRGKWVHMGRVNSFVRTDIARTMGCQSVDGTFLAVAPEINLPRASAWFERLERNPQLPWAREVPTHPTHMAAREAVTRPHGR